MIKKEKRGTSKKREEFWIWFVVVVVVGEFEADEKKTSYQLKI
jgi:hypothetical protein